MHGPVGGGGGGGGGGAGPGGFLRYTVYGIAGPVRSTALQALAAHWSPAAVHRTPPHAAHALQPCSAAASVGQTQLNPPSTTVPLHPCLHMPIGTGSRQRNKS